MTDWIKEARAACVVLHRFAIEKYGSQREMRNARGIIVRALPRALDALEKAEELEKVLWSAVEVMEFTYMNAPKQPKEIIEARQALAAYREACK